MAFGPVKNLVASAAEATPAQFDDWRKAWRAAATGGSTEPLLTFVARESGMAEDVFLQKLAAAIGWPFVDLHKHTVPAEARTSRSYFSPAVVLTATVVSRQLLFASE